MAGDCAIPNRNKNSTGDRMGRLQFLHHFGARHQHLMTLDKRPRQERERPGGCRNPMACKRAGADAGRTRPAPGHAPAWCMGGGGGAAFWGQDRSRAALAHQPELPMPGEKTPEGFLPCSCSHQVSPLGQALSLGAPRGWVSHPHRRCCTAPAPKGVIGAPRHPRRAQPQPHIARGCHAASNRRGQG